MLVGCCELPDGMMTSSNGNLLDSKVHGVNMGPFWCRKDPGGPLVGPMNFAIWAFPRHWSFVRGIHGPRWIPLTKASDAELWRVFFISVRTNVWINHRDAGDLRRYRTHYNVTAMGTYKPNLDPLLWVAILVSNGGCWDWLARTSGQFWRNWAWERSC